MKFSGSFHGYPVPPLIADSNPEKPESNHWNYYHHENHEEGKEKKPHARRVLRGNIYSFATKYAESTINRLGVR